MSAIEVLKNNLRIIDGLGEDEELSWSKESKESFVKSLKEALLVLEQKEKKNFTKQELSIFLRLIKNEINNLGDIYSTTTKEQLKVFRKIRQEYTNIELKLIKELEEGVEK